MDEHLSLAVGDRETAERLREEFPFLTDTRLDHALGAIRGGRAAAEAALAAIRPAEYAMTRNFLDGAVSRLSPYLRHGVLTLAEVRDHALSVARQPEEAAKFINELGWRDYWQRLYYALGEGVWKDREPSKTGLTAEAYKQQLPQELLSSTTRLNCMDSFSRQLQETGYLHNHARMWMAAYVVHWLRIRWQVGARWFLQHLLDGDPASNNLSWQWVAGTFSSKPYYFNRENLERYTRGAYCRDCAMRDACPFDRSYEALETQLFPRAMQSETPSPSIRQPEIEEKTKAHLNAVRRPLLWVHADSLNPKGEMFQRFPSAAACFVWDEAGLREEAISLKCVLFLEQCLQEMPIQTQRRRGDVAAEVLRAAKEANADAVIAMRTPDSRLLAAGRKIERVLPLVWLDAPSFAADQWYELKRFSRYWQAARATATLPTSR